jgi:hypothetical protein
MTAAKRDGPSDYQAEGLGPPQPLMHFQTPLGVGCKRLEKLPVSDCPEQPKSNSKKAKARSHRIDAPEGGQPTLSSRRQSEPRQAAAQNAAERQRRKRERGDGVGIVPVPAHLATFGRLLREAGWNPTPITNRQLWLRAIGG